nr:hypothetical protein B0A51_14054 [Rachicladosporium sp. CCFEE 5018]
MADHASPEDRDGHPRTYRFPGMKGYLPLGEEGRSLSTRGQALPTLISNRSSTNVAGLNQRPKSTRRRSSVGEDLQRRSTERSRESGHQHGVDRDIETGKRQAFVPVWGEHEVAAMNDRRMSVLNTPQMRSQRLIGNSNPRYRWEKYYKTEQDLSKLSKPLRAYYERCNSLIQNYLYIDRLLDSSLPHNLIQEYQQGAPQHSAIHGNEPHVPSTICEESTPASTPPASETLESQHEGNGQLGAQPHKVNRTKDIFRVKRDDESTPLLARKAAEDEDAGDADEVQIMPPDFEVEEETDSSSRVVTVAIYLNLAANTILLVMKIIVVAMSSSVSVLASLVDAALDFLSTAIIWVTTYLIARNDQYAYPIGRRRLEPVGVLVFSVIMITSFVQVALEGVQKLNGPDHSIVQLTVPAIAIMAGTVVIKAGCWFWCRLIHNSSVQALAQDAMTDVVFNFFSIVFPLLGFYAKVWWLDPLGGILLSLYVIFNWSTTSSEHIRNLTGAAASADERNILLYLTMRFAKTIKHIQGLQAYHSGDKLVAEVDIVLDEATSLRDSHDLGESLQYVLESVPSVDRAFVHMDYAPYNLPSHMSQG